jgi:hypothetical protein
MGDFGCAPMHVVITIASLAANEINFEVLHGCFQLDLCSLSI